MAVDRRSNAIRVIRRHILIIGIALLVPVIISFIVWMLATANGGTTAVGYGFPTTPVANGVVTLWAGGPSMPLTFVNFFNIAIDAVAFIVAGIAGLTMVGALGELVGGGEE
jgi:hypothetical protein